MRRSLIVLTAAALFLGVPAFSADDKPAGINGDGFITAWLLLAPIPLPEGQGGSEALDKQQVPNEAQLQPKAGDTVKAGAKELTWKEGKVKDYYFDFNDHLGQATEDSVGYAVTYITAPADVKGVQLKAGSDDQSKVYLNGKEVLKADQARAIEKDQDTATVNLKKGVNVLVFKVVNEKVDWSGCARLVDSGDKPVKGLKAGVTP